MHCHHELLLASIRIDM